VAAVAARLNHGAVSSRQRNDSARSEYTEDGLCSSMIRRTALRYLSISQPCALFSYHLIATLN